MESRVVGQFQVAAILTEREIGCQSCHIAGMAKKRLKRPRDTIERAKLIGDIATGQVVDEVDDGKDDGAVEFARRGGLKGGRARANVLTKKRRREIARAAAKARWSSDK